MELPECCAAAKERLIKAEFDASKAHVKALREHVDGKHAGFQASPPASKK